MPEDINKIKNNLKSSNLETSIAAIDSIVKNICELTEILFESFEKAPDISLTTERMSLAFDSYIKKLNSYLSGPDKDLSFWAASLLVHHKINNKQAEDILLGEVKGLSENTYLATTILCRTRNKRVLALLEEHLKLKNLDPKMRIFFSEKLDDA